MTENNKTRFIVDREQHRILVKRIFHAPLSLVWRSWTEAELLEKWFGPQPYQVSTLEMNFKEGGHWTYRLEAEGQETQWGRTEYHRIAFEEFFTASDLFLNQDLDKIPEIPVSQWRIDFSQDGEFTRIEVETRYPKKEDLENMIAWGYQEGFQTVMDQLDQLMATLVPMKNN